MQDKQKARRNWKIPTPMVVDDCCQSDPKTIADMSKITPGASPIHCQPWDIGTGVQGYHWEAPNPRAVLLLQHGYGEYAYRFVTQYNHLIPNLLNKGISVYAFDMWGHGKSPGKRALVDIYQTVDDHLAARRKLQERGLPIFLLGHSLGALVAVSSVMRDQNNIKGVVLTSGALYLEASSALRAFANLTAFFAPTATAPVQTAATELLYHGAEKDKNYTDDPLIYRGKLQMLTAATGGTLSHKSWKLYPAWKVPVLIMHGKLDEWTDPRGSQRFFDMIAAKDKTLHMVESGLHEVLNDTDKDKSLQTILMWLEKHLPSV
jgi:acylglycerol lipase